MGLVEKCALTFMGLMERGDTKRLATQRPMPGVTQVTDIPYLPDGHRGHLLDIYYPDGAQEPLPVVIDIHGGGLMYGYKELNKNYNFAIASRGFAVISLSYRLVPEVLFPDQVRDILAAFEWIATHATAYPCQMDNLFLTGDSAGALLAASSALVNASPDLQRAFETQGSSLRFNALGFTSGMFLTTRGAMAILRSTIYGKDYQKKAFYACMDFATLPETALLPPCYLVTSRQDFIRTHTLDFERALAAKGVPHQLHDWPKGTKERALQHVFSVAYPEWPESGQTIDEMTAYFLRYAKTPMEAK